MADRVVILSVAVTTLLMLMAVSTRSDWVDYPSGIRCCSNIPVDKCDPDNPDANKACRDVCHYGGCGKGGQCEYFGSGEERGCHCNC